MSRYQIEIFVLYAFLRHSVGCQSQAKTEGSSVTFNCSTSQPDSIEWRYTSPSSLIPQVVYVSGVGLIDDSGKFEMGHEGDCRCNLVLSTAAKSDTGMYTCVGEDGFGNVVACYNLTVFKPVQITTNGFNEGAVGDTFSVVCVTDMDESIAIRHRPFGQNSSYLLYARNSMINNTNRNIEVVRKGSREYQLTIRNATEDMYGMYECVDDNGLGPGEGSVTVTIRRSSDSTAKPLQTASGDHSTTEGLSIESAATNTALVFGIIAGVVIFAALLLAVIVCMRRHRCIKETSADAELCQLIIQQNSGNIVQIEKLRSLLLMRLSAREVAWVMFERGALDVSQLDDILVHYTYPIQAAETLLAILLKLNDDEVTDSFLSALEETDQKDLFNCIKNPDFRIDVRHIQVLQEQRSLLLDKMVFDEQLLFILVSRKVLSGSQRWEVMANHSPQERKQKLISLLERKSSNQFATFVKALEETCQNVIANELTMRLRAKNVDAFIVPESGNVESDVKTEQHLDEVVPHEPCTNTDLSGFDTYSIHSDLIRRNYSFLLKHLNPNNFEFIVRLCDKGVIDRIELEWLRTDATNVHQADRLLSVLSRKSEEQFAWFLDALDTTGQSFVANELRNQPSFGSPDERVISSKQIGLVCAIAILKDKLYCLCSPSKSRICVYSATSLQFERFILLEELGDELRGLTSCVVYDSLYISDWNSECIHRLNPHQGLNKRVKWWSTTGKPLGLSVNGKHNLLVVCHEMNCCENGLIRCKLVEYTARGDVLREVLLQADLEGTVHAIQLDDEFFLVSHSNEKKHRVCVVDGTGNVHPSYGEQGDKHDKHLGHVQHIAYDRANLLVYVADEDNDRILVLLLSDMELKFERYVMVEGKGGMRTQPRALWFDEWCDRLYIGDNSEIKVVNVRKPNRD